MYLQEKSRESEIFPAHPNTQVLLHLPASAYHLLLPFRLRVFLQIQLLADLFQFFTLLLFSFQILDNLLQEGKISK